MCTENNVGSECRGALIRLPSNLKADLFTSRKLTLATTKIPLQALNDLQRDVFKISQEGKAKLAALQEQGLFKQVLL